MNENPHSLFRRIKELNLFIIGKMDHPGKIVGLNTSGKFIICHPECQFSPLILLNITYISDTLPESAFYLPEWTIDSTSGAFRDEQIRYYW
jgi:hypothetical protein